MCCDMVRRVQADEGVYCEIEVEHLVDDKSERDSRSRRIRCCR